MSKLLYQLKKVFNQTRYVKEQKGYIELFKRTSDYINRNILSVMYKLNFMREKSDELPEIIQVSPDDINWNSTFSRKQFPTCDYEAMNKQFFFNKPIVGVLGGPWDKHKRKWGEWSFYKSLRNHFIEDLDWRQTDFYERNLCFVENRSKLERKCKKIEELYLSIKEKGYLSQSKLGNEVEICGNVFPNECRVGIGRNGEIIRLEQGRHRVSVAKLLDINEIPVLVVVRHKEWEKNRKKIKKQKET